MSIGSGSSGNCYYLGTEKEGIIIDSGIPLRTIAKSLKYEGIEFSNKHIKGIIVTHDHADHVRSVGILAHSVKLPIYSTHKVSVSIMHSRFIREDLSGFITKVEYEKPFIIGNFVITPFFIPHDSSDNVGYLIEIENVRFVLATDIGHVTETIKNYTKKATHLVVESNYDKEMLLNGDYPDYLKDRVSGPMGHISNDECATLLASCYHQDMKDIWLCHLSKENNHPELCWKTIEFRLFNEGIRVGKDVSLTVLKRTTPSPLYILN